MIDLAIRRPVATAAIYIALFALGVTSFRLIPVEDLPEVEFPVSRSPPPGTAPRPRRWKRS